MTTGTGQELTDQEIATSLVRMIDGKRHWLRNFSTGPKKRPDHEVETQRMNLEVLLAAANHFQARANAANPDIAREKAAAKASNRDDGDLLSRIVPT